MGTREDTPGPFEPGAAGSGVPLHYRAEILAGAHAEAEGIAYLQDGRPVRLGWGDVQRAFAAEIGEPEGVRTIVFDLVIGVEGKECLSLRFDADPGPVARSVARTVVEGVGSQRCDASLRRLADEGLTQAMHPDLEPFDEACLEAVRRRPL